MFSCFLFISPSSPLPIVAVSCRCEMISLYLTISFQYRPELFQTKGKWNRWKLYIKRKTICLVFIRLLSEKSKRLCFSQGTQITKGSLPLPNPTRFISPEFPQRMPGFLLFILSVVMATRNVDISYCLPQMNTNTDS